MFNETVSKSGMSIIGTTPLLPTQSFQDCQKWEMMRSTKGKGPKYLWDSGAKNHDLYRSMISIFELTMILKGNKKTKWYVTCKYIYIGKKI